MYDIPPTFYKALEDKFRGSREEITKRLMAYAPLLRSALPAGPTKRSAIDLGCGRGEWLELLNTLGFEAKGVDTDTEMIAYCRSQKLAVTQQDGIEYLAALPDASRDLITGFHIVEHMPIGHVIALFSQVRRVLTPNGIAIFESPNPENVQVGANRFYLDPTHQRPIPPLLLQFIGEFTGFACVEIMRLHPDAKPPSDPSGFVEPALQLLFGPQDYSVIMTPTLPAASLIKGFLAAPATTRS
jgi:SAM-dependent methyltransferase